MDATVDPLIGKQLANYRIDSLIKRGGMGQVYYGWDVMLQRPVAIKIIDARFRSNPSYAERFLREARVVAAWWHRHITPIYYADKQDGLYYFVMEYINGLDLRQLIQRYAADSELLPHGDVARIGTAVAEALDYAHTKGVIHRDVKPSNILISKDGRVLLSDFGLALAIDEGSQGEIFGTPQYIAPEQALKSANAVAQSDLYSLSAMLFEVLTGRPPFQDESPTALALQHIQQAPPQPSAINPLLSDVVDTVLLKGLSKAPEERYRTSGELMEALTAGLDLPVGVAAPMMLPSMPPGMESASSPLTISQLSVVDKIALQLEEDGREIPVLSGVGKKRHSRLRLFGIILAALLAIVFIGTAGWFWKGDELFGTAVVAAPTGVAPVAAAVDTPTATTTPTAAPTAVPTNTAAPTAVSTAVPTNTSTPVPTATPSVTPTTIAPPTSMPSPALTGAPLRLYYDNGAFYIYNLGDERVAVAPLALVALTDDGALAPYAFQGRAWAGIYNWLDPDWCVRIQQESLFSLEPTECADYNASVSLPRGNNALFWLPREHISLFRVFWNGQDIGDCAVAAGICTVRLPE